MGMPTGLRIFVPVAHESRFVHVPHDKITLCRILVRWEVVYILRLFFFIAAESVSLSFNSLLSVFLPVIQKS